MPVRCAQGHFYLIAYAQAPPGNASNKNALRQLAEGIQLTCGEGGICLPLKPT